MLGRCADGRHHRDGVEIVDRDLADDPTLPFARIQCVADEEQVELAALGVLRRFDVVVELGDALGLHLGMAPGGDMVAARIDEDAEVKLAGHVVGHAANWLRGRDRPRCSRRVRPR